MLWVGISIRARCTTLCDKVCQWLATGQWFSPVSSTNKTDHHDITEMLLKMALNTIEQTNVTITFWSIILKVFKYSWRVCSNIWQITWWKTMPPKIGFARCRYEVLVVCCYGYKLSSRHASQSFSNISIKILSCERKINYHHTKHKQKHKGSLKLVQIHFIFDDNVRVLST